MGLNDILDDGDEKRRQADQQCQKLRTELIPHCTELRENALIAIKQTLQAFDDLGTLEIPASLPRPRGDDEISMSVAVVTSPNNVRLCVEVVGDVKCYIVDQKLRSERPALKVHVSRIDTHPVKKTSFIYERPQGGLFDTSYALDQRIFESKLHKALEEL